jgi:hypothetical protein
MKGAESAAKWTKAEGALHVSAEKGDEYGHQRQ